MRPDKDGRLIGQAATLGRRPHCNKTSNPRSSRADQLWAWAEKVPVGAGGLLTPLEGNAPAGFAAIAIRPLPDAVPRRALTEGVGLTVDVRFFRARRSDDRLTTMNGISSGGRLAQAVPATRPRALQISHIPCLQMPF